MADPGTGGDAGAPGVRQDEPSDPFGAAVSIFADFENDFCKILIEICARKAARLGQLFQMPKTRNPNSFAKFSRLPSHSRFAAIPARVTSAHPALSPRPSSSRASGARLGAGAPAGDNRRMAAGMRRDGVAPSLRYHACGGRRPVAAGAGGIARRKVARRLAAHDRPAWEERALATGPVLPALLAAPPGPACRPRMSNKAAKPAPKRMPSHHQKGHKALLPWAVCPAGRHNHQRNRKETR